MLTGDSAKALEAFKAGKDVAATAGTPDVGGPEEVITTSDGDETSPLLTELEKSSEAPGSPEKTTPGKQAANPDKKRLAVDKGKNFIDVDYSDRKAIDDAFLRAHGMRKFQAERDQAIKARKELEGQYTPLKSNWESLETAWKKGGVEGLVDLLEGQQGAYKSHLSREVERAEFLRKATPEQRQALDYQDKQQAAEREAQQLRAENEEFKKRVESERETSEMRALEGKIHPAFDRHRFSGKMGNADDEQVFDSALWQLALKRLEPYEEQGLDITGELVEREFRSVAATLRKRIGAQAEKAVARTMDKKKQEATENAQAKAMSGFRGNKLAEEASDKIRGGDLTGLLRNWGKYGGLFNK